MMLHKLCIERYHVAADGQVWWEWWIECDEPDGDIAGVAKSFEAAFDAAKRAVTEPG